MRVDVINTGTELLLGNVINTHLAFLARELFPLGLRIQHQVTVPDGSAIRDALTESFSRSEIVLVTGGLGPTTDDLTREITAELLGLELIFDPAVMSAIEARFARRGIRVTERVQRQAHVPRGAAVLPNMNGTAPGLHLIRPSPDHQVHIFLLPGPPGELKPMFTESVLPVLKKVVPNGEIPECRSYRVIGLGESNVEDIVGNELLRIDGIELGYCARPGEVDVRVIGTKTVVERAHRIMLHHLEPYIASQDNRSLEEVVVQRLTERRETIAVAESCTGGFLANRITNVAGSSQVFMEGFVTYANEAKMRALKIDQKIIASRGAVSSEVAVAMAGHAMEIAGTDHAISTTGIAGPSGGTPTKPVGTVFIGIASRESDVIVEKHTFPTDRENFKWLVTQAALELLRRRIA